jgi:hypothetical protein
LCSEKCAAALAHSMGDREKVIKEVAPVASPIPEPVMQAELF